VVFSPGFLKHQQYCLSTGVARGMGTYMILVGAFFQHLFGIHGLSEVGKDEGLPVISNFKWGFPSRKRIKSKDPPNTLRHVAFSSCGKETITIIA